MTSHHHPDEHGICAACEATGLPAVAARDLKPGMLIQDKFNPGPNQTYCVGEVATVEVRPGDFLNVTWSWAWHKVLRGTDPAETVYAYPGGFGETVVSGASEYLPLPAGSVERPVERFPALATT
ncbi:hypothetical protein ACFY4B_27375 [Kitasatospora sp. NPDC001261]|uniref:hypothetical protein n=1 Tax=Kitasatospora sp. NPDC001261 TaxID=3364012 RepID=UPI0036C5D690